MSPSRSFADDASVADGILDHVGTFIVVVVVLMVVLVIIGVVATVLNARRLKKRGISPLASREEVFAHALRGDLDPSDRAGEGTGSVEQRLAALDELYRRGAITAQERDASRARILGTL